MKNLDHEENDTQGGDFWAGTRPGQKVTHGEASFELPILYLRNDLFGLNFSADAKKAKSILPSDNLHPVTLPNGRAIIGVQAYNYIETTIGPYGEVAIVMPVYHAKKPPSIIKTLPSLLQGNYHSFDMLVMHLPVTKVIARDAGRGEWGYTKFVADMTFDVHPDYYTCRMTEGDEHILTLHVVRRGVHVSDNNPFVTLSVRNRKLIRTVIPQRGTVRVSPLTKGCYLALGNHPVAGSLKELDISKEPLFSTYHTEHASILPAGEIIEEDIRPFDGYLGSNRVAEHQVRYTNFDLS